MNSIQHKFVSSLVFLIIIFLSLPAQAFFGGKFKEEVDKEKGAVKLVREVQRGGYDLVTVKTLKAWQDEKKRMVIVDTMPYEASYKKAHLPGAVQFLFPIPEMEAWDIALTDQKTQKEFEALLGADKDRLIVIYCGFVKCTRSHNGAYWAKRLGYKNVYRFPGGIYAWKGMDYPVGSKE